MSYGPIFKIKETITHPLSFRAEEKTEEKIPV